MGLLLSDTMLIDPLLDETLRLGDGLGAWAYSLDAAYDGDRHDAPDLSNWPRLTFRAAAWATDADP